MAFKHCLIVKKHSFVQLIITALFLLGYTVVGSAQVIYVTPEGGGEGDGSSWENATTFQQALSTVQAGQEIWLTVGLYLPHPTDRNVSFAIPSGVKVRGGFAGTELSPQERHLHDQFTRLSGDIGQAGAIEDNSFTVVSFRQASGSTLLEKVMIADGTALGFSRQVEATVCGGAVFNDASNGQSNPIIRDCVFLNNRARKGAGIYNYAENGLAAPVIEACHFINNKADFNGGAIYNDGQLGNASPTIIACRFENNKSDYGAGVLNRGTSGISNPIISDCLFVNNFSLSTGSAIYNLRQGRGETNPTIEGCQYLANGSTLGDDVDNTINNDTAPTTRKKSSSATIAY